jgi:hypothetical protein
VRSLENMQLNAVFLLELINTTAGIKELLFTGKERMASGADLHTKILLNGACFKTVAASASNRCVMVGRMDCFFHCFHLICPEAPCESELLIKHVDGL